MHYTVLNVWLFVMHSMGHGSDDDDDSGMITTSIQDLHIFGVGCCIYIRLTVITLL